MPSTLAYSTTTATTTAVKHHTEVAVILRAALRADARDAKRAIRERYCPACSGFRGKHTC